ncbi:nucleotidyltransferase family protein [Streptomyces sp. C10]|uniref:nucleotidyltransferase family protein n=1 Tax=Streptomyces sp. C10 TaxID=531941 RepID=UPI003980C87F
MTELALPVADRIDLVRSILTPFPDVASELHRGCFEKLVERYGAATVFEYLQRRNIVNAALVSHEWHPAVRDEDGPFWLFRQAALAIRELHRAEFLRLAEAFSTHNVPLLAYKGLALDLLIGNLDAPSFSGDIDALVHREHLAEARKIVEFLGYEVDLRIESGRVRRMPTRISRMTEESVYSFGQCQPYDRLVPAPALEPLAERVQTLMPDDFCTLSGRLHFKISIDLHYTLNLLTDDIGTRVKPAEGVWWENTQQVLVGDAYLSTLSDQVMSWALLHRLYVDTMLLQDTSIKTLCHIKLLSKHGRFDVPHIREFARRYPYLAPSLHYALRATDKLCELGVGALEDPVAIRAITAPLMNVGDCLPALLDFGFAFELDDIAGKDSRIDDVGVRIF